MKTNKKETISELKSALAHVSYQSTRYFRLLEQSKSLMLKNLEDCSKLSEAKLTKKELFSLIKFNFDYMRALNLFNYFREEKTRLLVKIKEYEDGNVNNSNK